MSNNYFFIGIAGSGMSALAQYLAMQGKTVKGSDRLFNTQPNHLIRKKLEKLGIETFEQGKGNISDTDTVIISTAIENTVKEYAEALQKGKKIIHRSELLAEIAEEKTSVAVAGTSGKSTTTAMIYTVFDYAGLKPSIINGSGLAQFKGKGLIGNSFVQNGRWLIFEADESDGTLINYKPDYGLILNIDRDHKEINELMKIFGKFAHQTKNLIVNTNNKFTYQLSKHTNLDFGKGTKYQAYNIRQNFNGINFDINDTHFFIPVIGLHNVENATATVALCSAVGIGIKTTAKALSKYKGIDRRMQIVGKKDNIIVIDDYAHNPAKIESAIKSCQNLAETVIAFFQPHGFAPLKFFRSELTAKLKNIMRPQDKIYFAPIYYAGGTTDRNISSAQVVEDLKLQNVNAHTLNHRNDFIYIIQNLHSPKETIILLMGARDASLDVFATKIFNSIP